MVCPYCGEDRDGMTDEHVVPKALGGALQPTNPFKLPVCSRCNGTCGRWVDGPFIRSWLIHNSRATAEADAIDFATNPTLPLVCIGKDAAWTQPPTQCDFWLGPTGDHIYHFHVPYPGEPVMVGRPPHLPPKDVDPGVVFVNIVATNPVWHPVIVDSIAQASKGASIHYLNASPNHQVPWPPVAQEHAEKLAWVQSQGTSERQAQFAVDVSCGERFMAKLALGFGSLFMNPEFILSDAAKILRTYLWTSDAAKRAAMGFRGLPLFNSGSQQFGEVLNWHGCHVFVLADTGDALALIVNFYGRYPMILRITDDRALWQGRVNVGVENGLLWVVAPGLRRAAGPLRLGELIADRAHPRDTGPLAELRKRIEALPPRQPHHLSK